MKIKRAVNRLRSLFKRKNREPDLGLENAVDEIRDITVIANIPPSQKWLDLDLDRMLNPTDVLREKVLITDPLTGQEVKSYSPYHKGSKSISDIDTPKHPHLDTDKYLWGSE